MVKGKIKFYGIKNKERYNAKTKTWTKLDAKELVMTIENPSFTDSAIEKIKKFYEGAENLPKWYSPLIDEGIKPEYMTFRTNPEYAPDEVRIVDKNGNVVMRDVSEIGMNDAEIVMTYNGCYFGAIKVLREGHKYDPFAEADFEELPFK